MTITSDQQAAKAWARRNSDGYLSLGDEYGHVERTQSPPGVTLTDAPLPPGTVQLTNPDDATLGRAVRHVHTYDPGLVEPA